MHLTPEELKSFPLWALDEGDGVAIEEWLGEWADVIRAVQRDNLEVEDLEPEVATEPVVRKLENVPVVVKWIHFDNIELGILLSKVRSNCDLVTMSAIGALLSNGDLVVQAVRVANHTGDPFSTITITIEKAPAMLFYEGLGLVTTDVAGIYKQSMEGYLSIYPRDKQNIIMPALEDLIGTTAMGFALDADMTPGQQLSMFIQHVQTGKNWKIKKDHLTIENGTVYTTPLSPISGAWSL